MIDLLLDQDFVDHWNEDWVFFAQLNLQKMIIHWISFNSNFKNKIIWSYLSPLVFLHITQIAIVKLNEKTNVSKDQQ
jgi:hypothetical protein